MAKDLKVFSFYNKYSIGMDTIIIIADSESTAREIIDNDSSLHNNELYTLLHTKDIISGIVYHAIE